MQSNLSIVQKAARAGAEAILERGRDVGDVRIKGEQTDVVTDTDIQSGIAVANSIKEVVPDARFVIEEEEVYDLAGVERGSLTDDEVWVIDPLDGTTSFIHGFPCFSVAVALLRSGEPVAGAVYNVASDELISAADGSGAYLGETRITCTETDSLEQALMVTGFPYDRGALFDRQILILKRFMKHPIHGVRRDGSAAVDCTHVAIGRADGFWEFGLKPWDMAAGVVILREADAHVTGIDGEPWSVESTGVIAANRALHSKMFEMIQSEK